MNFHDLHQLFSFIKHLTDEFQTQNSDMPSSHHNSPPKKITIKIMGFDNAINEFKLKETTQLHKLMTIYSELVGIPKEQIRFRFDGQAINDHDTPISLGLEEGDTIDTYLTQIGGGYETNSERPFVVCPNCKFKITEQSHSTFVCGLNIFQNLERSNSPQKKHTKNQIEQNKNNSKSLIKKSPSPDLNIHNYPNIRRFFHKKQQIDLIIEGNIASGKSTLINELEKLHMFNVLTLSEPLKEWQNIYGTNLLEKMYSDPCRWSFTFQIYVMLTMLKNHIHPAQNKIMERSIFAANNVFLKAHDIRQNMDSIEICILTKWYEHVMSCTPILADTIIYLKTSPEIAFQRLKRRNRKEECKLSIEYLRLIHDLYEKWMLNIENVRVITLNGNQNLTNIMSDLNEKCGLLKDSKLSNLES